MGPGNAWYTNHNKLNTIQKMYCIVDMWTLLTNTFHVNIIKPQFSKDKDREINVLSEDILILEGNSHQRVSLENEYYQKFSYINIKKHLHYYKFKDSQHKQHLQIQIVQFIILNKYLTKLSHAITRTHFVFKKSV